MVVTSLKIAEIALYIHLYSPRVVEIIALQETKQFTEKNLQNYSVSSKLYPLVAVFQ